MHQRWFIDAWRRTPKSISPKRVQKKWGKTLTLDFEITNKTGKLRAKQGRYRDPVMKRAKPLNLLTDSSKPEIDRRLHPKPKRNYNNQQNWT